LGIIIISGLIIICVGIDEVLAKHVAHLFIRDPISLFAEKVDQGVENESDHFEV
jgi:glutamate--cysteine ligase catalytic subunit